jgi:hypothetical protein
MSRRQIDSRHVDGRARASRALAGRANNKTMSRHPQEHVPMTTQNFTEKARPHVIEPHDTEAINQWLAAVRMDAALTQPTAFRLAQVLAAQKSPAISLTPEIRRLLGRDPMEWEEDLADLYRRGLLAMWQSLGSPWLVMLMRGGPTKVPRALAAHAPEWRG